MKNEEIILKLQAIGVKMYKQQLHKIFINPFYCGLHTVRQCWGRYAHVHSTPVSSADRPCANSRE